MREKKKIEKRECSTISANASHILTFLVPLVKGGEMVEIEISVVMLISLTCSSLCVCVCARASILDFPNYLHLLII